MPLIIEEVIKKAKVIEIALAMKNKQKREQNNEVKGKYFKKTNDKKKYEKSYNSKEKSVEEIIRRVLKEKERETTPTTVQCYRCGKEGHVKRECPEEKKYIPTKSTTVKFTPTCYKCGKKGHTAKFCRSETKEESSRNHDKGKEKQVNEETRQNPMREETEAESSKGKESLN